MKARSLLVLPILVLMMGGCSNVLHDGKGEVTIHKESSSSQTYNLDKDNKVSRVDSSLWKRSVAERLLQEFNDYYKKMQTDDSLFYNRIMAADRATGLLCVYKDYVSDASIKDIKDKQNKINKKIGDSTVLFGYTKSGLHIVALMDIQDNSSMRYEPACNLVRGYKQESNLFVDMFEQEGCYLSDIFIEDLSNKREKFKVNVDAIHDDGDALRQRHEVKNISTEGKETLKKYNRILEPKDGIYSNKTWRLIAVDRGFHFIRINVDGEKIDLLTRASDSQHY